MDETQPGAVAPAFDIAAYELEDFATFTPQNAKGTADLLGSDGQPVVIEVWGGGSRQAVKAMHRAGMKAQVRLNAVFRGKIDAKSAEQADEERVDKLVAFTKSISANFPVTPANLFGNPKLGYIARQVEKFADEDANFAKGSTNS